MNEGENEMPILFINVQCRPMVKIFLKMGFPIKGDGDPNMFYKNGTTTNACAKYYVS